MIEILEQIKNNKDVRQNLSKLRLMIKHDDLKKEFLLLIEKQYDILISLLQNTDAKTRKNTALLIGDLVLYECLDALFEAYKQEKQLFVKSSYLSAMKHFDIDIYIPELKERFQLLSNMEISTEQEKHIKEELHFLTELILSVEGMDSHRFIMQKRTYECALITNPSHSIITLDQLKNCEVTPFANGLFVTTSDLESLLSIRTFKELLFVIPDLRICDNDAKSAGTKIAKSQLISFLSDCHDGSTPFYFRVEIRSPMPLDKKSAFAKKIAAQIEQQSNRQLVNSTSNYEIELRLVQTKEGSFYFFVKLLTLKDERFSYRQEVTSSSIKPVDAALLVELAKDYMIPNAQVLDPFCGVGTMLIERQKIVKGNTSYGIDILNSSIIKANINTTLAGQIIHFINKDFFDFTHDYLFDEIFTNMPFAMGHTMPEQIYTIYKRFFAKAKTLLTKKGHIIMLSHDYDYVYQLTKQMGFTILKEFVISEKKSTHLFVIS